PAGCAARNAWRGLADALDANQLRRLSTAVAAGEGRRARLGNHDRGTRPRNDSRRAARCSQASAGERRPARTWRTFIENDDLSESSQPDSGLPLGQT
ncbi:MAG: hypothetical protein QOH42_1278, partial [Blastocatellia bacterium]|nr:hypothetical protein [Blastocatellia bacterium]